MRRASGVAWAMFGQKKDQDFDLLLFPLGLRLGAAEIVFIY